MGAIARVFWSLSSLWLGTEEQFVSNWEFASNGLQSSPPVAFQKPKIYGGKKSYQNIGVCFFSCFATVFLEKRPPLIWLSIDYSVLKHYQLL